MKDFLFLHHVYPAGIFAALSCPLETTLSLEDSKTVLRFAKPCGTEVCVDYLYLALLAVSEVK